MSFQVRDGKFDVVVLAGPRVSLWPSAGVRALSTLCAEVGLSVGQFGGSDLKVRGVIPDPGTGGIVLIEDVQNRIHRIQARAIVRLNSDLEFPNPFLGWRSPGLIPLSTALRLRQESRLSWNPGTVILGTGNPALRFASSLLETDCSEVYCVETSVQWGAKRFAGWEVERRRFESQGGKIIEAVPIKLSAKAPLLWEFKLKDAQGVRVLDVARVVSAGPFSDFTGVREYPPGSFLYELEQSARATRAENVEGWALEEERGRWLGARIARALVSDLGDKREDLDRSYKRARSRLKRYFMHREFPFTPSYQGKWLAPADAKRIRNYRALPQIEYQKRLVASVECFEDIPCNVCQTVCPENAIEIGHVPRERDALLIESKCTACGICLTACPSSAIVMVEDKPNHSQAKITLPWNGTRLWKAAESPQVVNRRGELLGTARVISVEDPAPDSKTQLVHLEIASHLAWEARGLRRPRVGQAEDLAYMEAVLRSSDQKEKVEVNLNGEKRRIRGGVSVLVALFEIGQTRENDVLYCPDGSCGLCQIEVDGTKKLACKTEVHQGMSMKFIEASTAVQSQSSLCPCLGIDQAEVTERLTQGNLKSPEAVLSVTHVGEGKCHGQFCVGIFKRSMKSEGLDVAQWIDWRFPWSEWTLNNN